MRWIAGFVFLLQAAALPPAYPRPGTSKLLENDRVQVWDISWLKQTYPLHRHRYDLIGVYYTDGDRMIVSQQGERRPVSTKAWETAFQAKDVTHIEEGASDAPLRAVFVEMKEPAATGAVDTAGRARRVPSRNRQAAARQRAGHPLGVRAGARQGRRAPSPPARRRGDCVQRTHAARQLRQAGHGSRRRGHGRGRPPLCRRAEVTPQMLGSPAVRAVRPILPEGCANEVSDVT